MLLTFSLLALLPNVLAHPHAHAAWGVNAYNLAAIAAVWIYAQWLASHRRSAAIAPSLG